MLNTLIIGADQLGNIPKLLQDKGCRVVGHISGRETSAQRAVPNLPKGLDLMVLFTDFLGHNVMKSYRQAATRAGVQIIASRRSVSALQSALELRLRSLGLAQ